MKKLIRMICLTLVICLACSVAASAETVITPRANAYIAAHNAYLYKTGTYDFQIWFNVTANAMDIDMIGAYRIIVYKSADQVTWKEMRTYEYTDNPEMMDYDSGFHSAYVTYRHAAPGYYYRAYLILHAEDSAGSGRVYRYTDVLQI